MANNRLWMINRSTGERLLLAKYYPSTGWYVHHENLPNMLNAMLNKPGDVPMMYGGCPFLLEYEMGEDDQRKADERLAAKLDGQPLVNIGPETA